MPKSLGYYASGAPAIDALASSYGDCLEDMPLDEKLLAIKAVSGALLDSLVNQNTEPSIEEQVLDRIQDGYEVDPGLQDALTALDGCDERQCFALLGALVAYAEEEFRQFGGAVRVSTTESNDDWEPVFYATEAR